MVGGEVLVDLVQQRQSDRKEQEHEREPSEEPECRHDTDARVAQSRVRMRTESRVAEEARALERQHQRHCEQDALECVGEWSRVEHQHDPARTQNHP